MAVPAVVIRERTRERHQVDIDIRWRNRFTGCRGSVAKYVNEDLLEDV
jgi:hypothetical protein